MTKARNKFEEAFFDLPDDKTIYFDPAQWLVRHNATFKEALQIAADSVVPEDVMSSEEFFWKLNDEIYCLDEYDCRLNGYYAIPMIEQRDRQLLAEANREIERLRELMKILIKETKVVDQFGNGAFNAIYSPWLHHKIKQALETK